MLFSYNTAEGKQKLKQEKEDRTEKKRREIEHMGCIIIAKSEKDIDT